MIDKQWIGHSFPDIQWEIERGRLKFFAEVIGVDDPIYFDAEAARTAGYRDIPALPSFIFAAELDTGSLPSTLDALEIDTGKILHGEQSIVHHATAYAGDRLVVTPRISDIFDKKGGALEILVKETQVTDLFGLKIADMTTTIVVRNYGAGL